MPLKQCVKLRIIAGHAHDEIKRRRRGEIGSIHRSILVGHRRPNRRQRVNLLIIPLIEKIYENFCFSTTQVRKKD